MKKSPSPRRGNSLSGLGDAFWDRLRVRCGRRARPGSAASCSPGTAGTCPGTASASRRCRRRRRRPLRTAERKTIPQPATGKSLSGLGGCFWGTGLKARCGRRARRGSAGFCSPGTAGTCPGTASASPRCRRRRRPPLRTAEMKKSPSRDGKLPAGSGGFAFWDRRRARRSRRARRGSAEFCSPGTAGTCPGTASASPRCRRRRRPPLRTAEMKQSPSRDGKLPAGSGGGLFLGDRP